MRILGCDPGLTGALALYDTADKSLVIEDIPTASVTLASGKKRNEMNDAAVASVVRQLAPDIAALELVHAMPKQGIVSTFRFGETFGVLRGVLAACGIPLDLVRPQEWQLRVQYGRGDDAGIRRASQLFPKYANYFARKKDHNRADAALIAYYQSLVSAVVDCPR
jgi:hypothetical protein